MSEVTLMAQLSGTEVHLMATFVTQISRHRPFLDLGNALQRKKGETMKHHKMLFSGTLKNLLIRIKFQSHQD